MKAFHTRFAQAPFLNQAFANKLVNGMVIALLSNFSVASTIAIAQPSTPHSVNAPPLLSPIEFVPPVLPDRGRPRGRSSGTASRGACEMTGSIPLTAIVPVTQVTPEAIEGSEPIINVTYESVFSLTTQTDPSFWFYVPYSPAQVPLTFVLQNEEQNQTLYEVTYPQEVSVTHDSVIHEIGTHEIGTREMSNREMGTREMGTREMSNRETGVLQVHLPEAEISLEEGRRYYWHLMAECDENASSFVEGWIERVPVDGLLSEELLAAAPQEKARLYAQKGIWQDSITLLGQQLLNGEAEAQEHWRALLSSIGLDAVAQQPLIDCCKM